MKISDIFLDKCDTYDNQTKEEREFGINTIFILNNIDFKYIDLYSKLYELLLSNNNNNEEEIINLLSDKNNKYIIYTLIPE